MDSTTSVKWSNLCDTEVVTALAYYYSLLRLNGVGPEADIVYRNDFIRNLCEADVVGRSDFLLRGDGCSGGLRRLGGIVSSDKGVGIEPVASGCPDSVASGSGEDGPVCEGELCDGVSNEGVASSIPHELVGERLSVSGGSAGERVAVASCGGGGRSEFAVDEGCRVSSSPGLSLPGSLQRGKHYEKNKAKRERRKKEKSVRVVKTEAQLSLEAKWKAENELAAERARQQLEVLKARDIEQVKKADGTRWRSRVERNMVSIEKTHATLKATGNVPGVPPVGYAETLEGSAPGLSSGECSISPDSSASMHEFRRVQKELLDKTAQIEKMEKIFDRMGYAYEYDDLYGKKVWTDTKENEDIIDKMYPDYSYVKDVGNAGEEGKFLLQLLP